LRAPICHRNPAIRDGCGVRDAVLREKFPDPSSSTSNRSQKSTANFVYVIVSILMVVLWSAYLCFDGRREPKSDTRVIHKLAQSTLLRAVP
uniref:Ovule protein n=1 Tax=Haemonchus placei TaxID=6290 RepID=A0A0N4VU09_HAEPC